MRSMLVLAAMFAFSRVAFAQGCSFEAQVTAIEPFGAMEEMSISKNACGVTIVSVLERGSCHSGSAITVEVDDVDQIEGGYIKEPNFICR